MEQVFSVANSKMTYKIYMLIIEAINKAYNMDILLYGPDLPKRTILDTTEIALETQLDMLADKVLDVRKERLTPNDVINSNLAYVYTNSTLIKGIIRAALSMQGEKLYAK